MASSGWQAWNGLYTSSFGFDYFKCSIRIDSITHSGNTATISGAFGVKNEGSYTAHYDYPITARIRDVTNYQQVVSGGYNFSPGGIVDSGVSFSFSVPASDTTASFTIDWVYNNGYANNVYTYTVNFETSYTAPDRPTISVGTRTANTIVLTYGTTSFGNPSTGTVYLYGGDSASPTTQIASKTTTGNSSYTHSGLVPNTKYYYRSKASNSQASSDYYTTFGITLPVNPTVSVGSVSGKDAVINYSMPADGGYHNKIIQYSRDGGVTWETGVGIYDGDAHSGSFTIKNLRNGENAVLIRTYTLGDVTDPITLLVEIDAGAQFYGPVREYTIVSSSTSRVSENMFRNFTAEGFMQAYEAKYGKMYGIPDYILVNHIAEDGTTGTGKYIWLYFADGSSRYCDEVPAGLVVDLNIWGMDFPGSEGSITANADKVAVNYVYSEDYKAKSIKKFYGPVDMTVSLANSTIRTPSVITSVDWAKFKDGLLGFIKKCKYREGMSRVTEVEIYKMSNGRYMGQFGSMGANRMPIDLWQREYGVVINADAGDAHGFLDIVATYTSKSKEAIKIYGSVNGVTKLIF